MPLEICGHESSMNQKLKRWVAIQALKIWIPRRDTIPILDPTLFPFKSPLDFACLFFRKTIMIF